MELDALKPFLRVERAVEETRAGLRVKPPKTKRGRRTISLPPEAVAMLRKVKQMKTRLALCLGAIKADTWVFSTLEGGLISPDNLSRDWRRVVLAKKLPQVSFHALRHTHASVRKGVDILTISRRLGHYKPSITLDTYGHLIGGADEAAADAIAGVLI